MRRSIIIILSAFLMLAYTADAMARSESTRQERRLIMKGNKQYVDRKFVEAASSYTQALSETLTVRELLKYLPYVPRILAFYQGKTGDMATTVFYFMAIIIIVILFWPEWVMKNILRAGTY